MDPGAVDRWRVVSLLWGVGRVRGGDWDRPERPESRAETVTYRGLGQRFEEGRDWAETADYERAEEQFADGERVRGDESLDALRAERLPAVADHPAVQDVLARPGSGGPQRDTAGPRRPGSRTRPAASRRAGSCPRVNATFVQRPSELNREPVYSG